MTEEIRNARTGQRMCFLSDSDPGELRIRTVNPPTGVPEPVHVHPRQESGARVISGTLTFVVDGKVHRVGAGEQIAIPAGVPHHFLNDGDEDAVADQWLRPALRSEQFFRTYFDLANRGELNAKGMPSALRLAVLVPEFADEMRVVRPPWWVQRIACALLAPVARMRGVRVPT
jgi:mannose-6-phosphate isomerase-like protein (cupin superfamily)